MNFLPLELLDIILQKSYLHYAFNRGRFKDESDRFLVTRFATVDRCWSERLRKRKFKRIIYRRLSGEIYHQHQSNVVSVSLLEFPKIVRCHHHLNSQCGTALAAYAQAYCL